MPKKKKIKRNIVIPNINKAEDEYPLFCFKHLQEHSYLDIKDHKFFIDFLGRLRDLSKLGWKEIRTSARHAFGMEKIPISQIKPQCNNIPIITPDVEHLHVFRACGDNRVFVGIQEQNTFHVLFIEGRFNDIYEH